ncbi:putative bifunctional diguanylate cyclase/phosphodiesterase [Roseibium sp.]|uniref:putative bifunctional diguanylate cyclase/phosphodiesterase n=1 Tax=Roseibium sp. TaxID=1936156 RepID=UPI003B51FFB9
MTLSATTIGRTVFVLVATSFICLTVTLYLMVTVYWTYNQDRSILQEISETIGRTSTSLGLSPSMPLIYRQQLISKIVPALQERSDSIPLDKWQQLQNRFANALSGIESYNQAVKTNHSEEYLDHLHVQSMMHLSLILEENGKLSRILYEQQANRTLFFMTLTGILCVILMAVLTGSHVLFHKVLFRPIIQSAKHIRANQVAQLQTGSRLAVTELSWLLMSLKESWHQLEVDATHDHLTRLPNRLFFSRRLNLSTNQLEENNRHIAILMLDLDDFKLINDTLGHPAGDELLKVLANRLSRVVRGTDCLARLGGDEFAIVLEGLDPIRAEAQTASVAEKILTAVEQPFEIAGHSLLVHLSIGIALGPKDGGDPSLLMRNADAALYRAKAQGKGKKAYYSEDLTTSMEQNLSLEREIKEGLTSEQFYLAFQPKVDTRTNRVIGLEALLRWSHPERGTLNPAAFLPFAEKNSLMHMINDYVLTRVFRQCADWRAMGRTVPVISINLDANYLRMGNLCKKIEGLCKNNHVSADYFCFEITEGTFLNYSQDTKFTLDLLRQMGIKIAIDDFGTGFSCLSYIQDLPVDELKIDKSFINNVDGPDYESPVLEAIMALGNGYHIGLIAEGVETEHQLEYLQSRGCFTMQGYFTGKPVPSESLPWSDMQAPSGMRSSRPATLYLQ